VNQAAVTVDGVWKTFRIFTDRSTTLKQAVLKRRGAQVFEEFWALKDVSFEVPKGSTFGIVGSNGAGKSTMLKVLARILVPDKGSVQLRGRMSALLELGAGFHPELTGRENVFLNGAILGMSRASLAQRFDEIVGFAGLEKFIDQPVKTYSSGMYARLGFAVAVNVDPEILLVDEVLAVGDEQFQRRCTEKMAEIRAGGRTVIFVSHNLGQVQQLCDEAVWLDHGQVQLQGNVQRVVDAYLASVTTDYRVDLLGRQRIGSREIELEASIEANGESAVQFVTGQPVQIRFAWDAHQSIPDAIFGFTIRSAEGVAVFGHSTAYCMDRTLPSGRGEVTFDIPALPLLPGSYMLSAAILSRHSGHIYDHSPDMAKFDVSPNDSFRGETGFSSMFGQWRVDD